MNVSEASSWLSKIRDIVFVATIYFVFVGFIYRYAYLEQLGIPMPATIDGIAVSSLPLYVYDVAEYIGWYLSHMGVVGAVIWAPCIALLAWGYLWVCAKVLRLPNPSLGQFPETALNWSILNRLWARATPIGALLAFVLLGHIAFHAGWHYAYEFRASANGVANFHSIIHVKESNAFLQALPLANYSMLYVTTIGVHRYYLVQADDTTASDQPAAVISILDDAVDSDVTLIPPLTKDGPP